MVDDKKLALVADVAAAYLRRNSVSVDQIGQVVQSVTRALEAAANGQPGDAAVTAREAGGDALAPGKVEPAVPAVPVRNAVHPDYLVCLVCGIKAKTLKRHLGSAHQLSPESYRQKFGLRKDFPITAPAYSERRSKMAKKIGLGRVATAKRTRKR
jgi:predicted transcriptional regulator